MTKPPVIQSIAEAIRSSSVSRASTLSRLRRETRAALAASRRTRQRARRLLRRSLREHRAEVIASLGPSSEPDRGGGIEPIDTSRHQEADVPSESACGVWDLDLQAEDEGLAGNVLRAEILRVLERHPIGAAARDVGNELGVDWRRVVATIRQLVDEGMVDRLGQHFYVARKAGGRW